MRHQKAGEIKPFALRKSYEADLDAIGRFKDQGLLAVRKGHIFPKRRIKDVGKEPWEIALSAQMPELEHSKVEIMILRRKPISSKPD